MAKQIALIAAPIFTPDSIRSELLIQSCWIVDGRITVPEERGDLAIRGLWNRGTDGVIDVRVTDVDAPGFRRTPATKVIMRQEREKKKYLPLTKQSRKDFTPFVISVDGMAGREAKDLLKHLARKLSKKWDRHYSIVSGYIKASISLDTLRATTHCIHGTRA